MNRIGKRLRKQDGKGPYGRSGLRQGKPKNGKCRKGKKKVKGD